jgi:STE24 endopeptidase
MNNFGFIIVGIITLSFLYDFVISFINFKHRKQPVEAEVEDVYDKKSYEVWMDYSLEKYRVTIITKFIFVVINLLLIIFNGFNLFENVSIELTSNPHIQVIIFLAMYFGIFLIVSIVSDYYDTFKIEEKYGFNKSTKKLFFKDQIIEVVVTILIALPMLYGFSVLFTNASNTFFVIAYISLIIIIVLFNMLFVVLIIPLFYKKTPLEEGELKEKLSKLSSRVGYELKSVVVINVSSRTSKLNAYFSGFGKSKKVMLADTLFEKLTTDEIVAVVAHEIGHSVCNHMMKDLLKEIITTGIYLALFTLVLNTSIFADAFNLTTKNIAFGLVVFLMMLAPIRKVLTFISATISRKHEKEADMYVVDNGYGEEYINAFKKVARENFGHLNPHPLFVLLKYSHPPLATRIKYVKERMRSRK